MTKLLRTCDKKFPWHEGILCSFYYSFFRVITFGSGTAPAGMYYVSRKSIPVSRSLGIFTISYTIQRIAVCLYFLLSFVSNYGSMDHYFGEYRRYMAATAMMTALSGVIPAPGGVGAVEFIFVLLFTPLTGKAAAASGMLIYRFATYILPFLLGAPIALKIHSSSH